MRDLRSRLDQQELISRLRTAQGHLSAVIKMVEQDQPCEKVLRQMMAVKGSLEAASALMVEGQVKSSLDCIRSNPSPDQRCIELDRLLDLYCMMNKRSSFSKPGLDEVKHE
jgi:DNA-binding FrmR family transcriptional regulator